MRNALLLLVMVLSLTTYAVAGQLDEAFDKVNKNLYGIGSGDEQQAEPVEEQQPESVAEQPAPRQKLRKQVEQPAAEDQAEPETSADRTSASEDIHFLQGDDYFIQEHSLGNQAWMYVNLAKIVSPPSSATKGEGEFMKVVDGQNLWTGNYWRTRIAGKSELKLGMHVIAFNDNHRNDAYQAPDKKETARGGAWFYAKITDMSDVYKGYVTVSGNYKVSLNNLRVIIR